MLGDLILGSLTSSVNAPKVGGVRGTLVSVTVSSKHKVSDVFFFFNIFFLGTNETNFIAKKKGTQRDHLEASGQKTAHTTTNQTGTNNRPKTMQRNPARAG